MGLDTETKGSTGFRNTEEGADIKSQRGLAFISAKDCRSHWLKCLRHGPTCLYIL